MRGDVVTWIMWLCRLWIYGFDAFFSLVFFFYCFRVQVPFGIYLWPLVGQTGREGTHATGCQPSGGYTCRISDGIGFASLELGAQGLVLPTGNKDIGIDLIVYHICYRAKLSKYHDIDSVYVLDACSYTHVQP